MIVLGSGGHTAEMLHMFERSLNALNGKDLNEFLYHPRTYVVADTDKYSENKARHLEEKFGFKEYDDFSFSRIPRIREVGQSWLSTALSALRTLYPSLYTVWNSEPELVCFIFFLLLDLTSNRSFATAQELACQYALLA